MIEEVLHLEWKEGVWHLPNRAKSYSGYLVQEYGDINWDFKSYLGVNASYINHLRMSGYELHIENGPLVKVITYSRKDDLSSSVEQKVYRNQYFMQRDASTTILLCEGLAYRSDIPFSELKDNYVIKHIVDLELKVKPKYGHTDSPLEYLCARYAVTEPAFVQYLTDCREFIGPYLAKAYSEGYHLKVSLHKTKAMKMFRLKEQYRLFAQDRQRLNVIVNDKLTALPTQLIATSCVKTYELIKSSGESEGKVVFASKGYASIYDLYLASYYQPVG